MTFPIAETRFDLPDRSAVQVLRGDLIEYERELEAAPHDERLRRSYVRAAMALVDATVHYIKHMAYNFATQMVRPVQQHLGPNLQRCPVTAVSQVTTDGELSMLLDQVPSVKGSGEIDTTTTFLDFRRNVKFALRSATRIFDARLELNLATDCGWNALSEAADIRNRLVHPKPGESMSVSNDEVEIIRAGYSWMITKEMELTAAIGVSALRILTELEAWLREFEPEFRSQLQAQFDAFNQKTMRNESP